MGELGALLELLVGARPRFRTVRATIVVRRDPELEARGRDAVFGAPDPKDQRAWEAANGIERLAEDEVVRLWAELPSRKREQRRGWTAIHDGGRWWHYDENGVESSNEGDPEVGLGVPEDVGLLLDPAVLAGALWLEPAGRSTVAGREAVLAVGRRRGRGLEFNLHEIGYGDEFELAVDAERGVLLHCASRLGGGEMLVHEVTEISFDEELPPELFGPVPGARKERHAEPVQVDPGEAAALASFAVWVPPVPAEGWRTRGRYTAADDRSPEVFTLSISRLDAAHSIDLFEFGEKTDWFADLYTAETVEHGGREVRIGRPIPRNGMATTVHAVLDGTYVVLRSESLGLDGTLDVLDSLRPVDPGPP